MAGEHKIRVEFPLSEAVPTLDDVREHVARYRYPCEVVPPNRGARSTVMHCDVLAPAGVSDEEIRRQFRAFIERRIRRHGLREEAKSRRLAHKARIAEMTKGLLKRWATGQGAAAKNLIFVSCGQSTETEKTLGLRLKATIDAIPGFEAYLAETVHDFDTLGRNVFEALRQCAGAVVVLHDRGMVIGPEDEKWGYRSSVWINQELAILAYRQFFEVKKIPVLPFIDPKVKLEGAMTSLIVNPRPLGSPQDVAFAVTQWLANSQFGAVSNEALRQ